MIPCQSEKILNIPIDSLFSFTKICYLKRVFFENLNISTNNWISVEAAKVLQYIAGGMTKKSSSFQA